jgi:uncharacterized coiled-coil protein SlyX
MSALDYTLGEVKASTIVASLNAFDHSPFPSEFEECAPLIKACLGENHELFTFDVRRVLKDGPLDVEDPKLSHKQVEKRRKVNEEVEEALEGFAKHLIDLVKKAHAAFHGAKEPLSKGTSTIPKEVKKKLNHLFTMVLEYHSSGLKFLFLKHVILTFLDPSFHGEVGDLELVSLDKEGFIDTWEGILGEGVREVSFDASNLVFTKMFTRLMHIATTRHAHTLQFPVLVAMCNTTSSPHHGAMEVLPSHLSSNPWVWSDVQEHWNASIARAVARDPIGDLEHNNPFIFVLGRDSPVPLNNDEVTHSHKGDGGNGRGSLTKTPPPTNRPMGAVGSQVDPQVQMARLLTLLTSSSRTQEEEGELKGLVTALSESQRKAIKELLDGRLYAPFFLEAWPAPSRRAAEEASGDEEQEDGEEEEEGGNPPPITPRLDSPITQPHPADAPTAAISGKPAPIHSWPAYPMTTEAKLDHLLHLVGDTSHLARYHYHKDVKGIAGFAESTVGQIKDLRETVADVKLQLGQVQGQVRSLQGKLHNLPVTDSRPSRQQEPPHQHKVVQQPVPEVDYWAGLTKQLTAEDTGKPASQPVSDLTGTPTPLFTPDVTTSARPAQRVTEPKLDINGDVSDFFRKMRIYFTLANTPASEQISRAVLNIASPTVVEQWSAYAETHPEVASDFDTFQKQITIYAGGYGAEHTAADRLATCVQGQQSFDRYVQRFNNLATTAKVSFTDPLIIRGFIRGISDPTLRTLVCTGPAQTPWTSLSDLQAHAAIIAASARPNAPASISPKAPRPHAGKSAKLAAKRHFGGSAGMKKDNKQGGGRNKHNDGYQKKDNKSAGGGGASGSGGYTGPAAKKSKKDFGNKRG